MMGIRSILSYYHIASIAFISCLSTLYLGVDLLDSGSHIRQNPRKFEQRSNVVSNQFSFGAVTGDSTHPSASHLAKNTQASASIIATSMFVSAFSIHRRPLLKSFIARGSSTQVANFFSNKIYLLHPSSKNTPIKERLKQPMHMLSISSIPTASKTSSHVNTQTSLGSTLRESDTDSTESESDDASRTSSSQDDFKILGNKMILESAIANGATEKMIEIQWKSDRIVVTVDVHADGDYDDVLILGDLDEDEEDVLEDDDYDGEADMEYWDENDDEFEEYDASDESDDMMDDSEPSGSIDLTLIARAINERLSRDGESSLGYRIAQMYEIEVTTPEFDNVLRGQLMFESYKGFDVIVEHYEDPKKKKKKTKGKSRKESEASEPINTEDDAEGADDNIEKKIKVTEGKLVGREDGDSGTTKVNVKGRIVKIKNEYIESVKLPKAKREKGAK